MHTEFWSKALEEIYLLRYLSAGWRAILREVDSRNVRWEGWTEVMRFKRVVRKTKEVTTKGLTLLMY